MLFAVVFIALIRDYFDLVVVVLVQEVEVVAGDVLGEAVDVQAAFRAFRGIEKRIVVRV